MPEPIRVVIVDDSAFIRKVLRQILSKDPQIEVVGTASSGEEALEVVGRLTPDVIILDLNMPGMDGLEFLRRQKQIRSIPVVICSVTHQTAAAAVAALELGATDFVQKPTALATDLVYDLAEELVSKVKAAAAIDMGRLLRPAGTGAPQVSVPAVARAVSLIVIGVSTGGPQALRAMIPRLPRDFPVPIVIVLHMPIGFTAMYAARLNEISDIDVHEARQGERLTAGSVFLAPAGQHLRIRSNGKEGLVASLSAEPREALHRPSVDVLFESAAESCGERVVGVVMTGMGTDGLAGSRRVKERGGTIVTESAESCVVYGMPRAVEEAGLSDHIRPLDDLPAVLAELV